MTTSPSQGSGEDSHARERRLEKDEKILYIVGIAAAFKTTRLHSGPDSRTRGRARKVLYRGMHRLAHRCSAAHDSLQTSPHSVSALQLRPLP